MKNTERRVDDTENTISPHTGLRYQRRRNRAEAMLEDIMPENVPKLQKDTNLQI